MKPQTYFTVSLVLATSLCACSGGKSSSQTSETATAGETTTTGEDTTTDGPTSEGTTTTDTSEPTTEGPDTTASTTAEPTGDPILIEPDMGEPVTCDLFDDNCPEGQKCMPYAADNSNTWNALGCFDVMGDATSGEPCTAIDSAVSGHDTCAPGHMCWYVDNETLMGSCVAFCEGSPEDPTCAQPMSECILSGNGPLALCLPTCDVLSQDCADGLACYPNNDTTVCVPVELPDDQGNAGQPCEYINGCQPGLMCLQGQSVPGCESPGCCAPFCDLSDPMCEPPGTECTGLFEMPDPWEVDYGVCALPG